MTSFQTYESTILLWDGLNTSGKHSSGIPLFPLSSIQGQNRKNKSQERHLLLWGLGCHGNPVHDSVYWVEPDWLVWKGQEKVEHGGGRMMTWAVIIVTEWTKDSPKAFKSQNLKLGQAKRPAEPNVQVSFQFGLYYTFKLLRYAAEATAYANVHQSPNVTAYHVNVKPSSGQSMHCNFLKKCGGYVHLCFCFFLLSRQVGWAFAATSAPTHIKICCICSVATSYRKWTKGSTALLATALLKMKQNKNPCHLVVGGGMTEWCKQWNRSINSKDYVGATCSIGL